MVSGHKKGEKNHKTFAFMSFIASQYLFKGKDSYYIPLTYPCISDKRYTYNLLIERKAKTNKILFVLTI